MVTPTRLPFSDRRVAWRLASGPSSSAGVDTDCDVGRPGMDGDLNFGVFPMETVPLAADVFDRVARHGFEPVGRDQRRTTHLARRHDQVGQAPGFRADSSVGGRARNQIDDEGGNALTDLIGMSFGNICALYYNSLLYNMFFHFIIDDTCTFPRHLTVTTPPCARARPRSFCSIPSRDQGASHHGSELSVEHG